FVRHAGLAKPPEIEGYDVVTLVDALHNLGPIIGGRLAVLAKPQQDFFVVIMQERHFQIATVMENVAIDKEAFELRASGRLPCDLERWLALILMNGPGIHIGISASAVELCNGLSLLRLVLEVIVL